MIKKETIVRDINRENPFTGTLLKSGMDEQHPPEITGPDEEMKIKLISNHFRKILQVLGMDPDSDSFKETPDMVAGIYVKEIFRGLNPDNKPEITLFENKHHYSEMVVEKNITLYSYCEHYFVPFTARVQLAYIPRKKTISSIQLKQLLQYHSSKLQSKEKLIEEIALSLKDCLAIQDLAVIIEGLQYPVGPVGINAANSSTITAHFSGKFQNEDSKREFFSLLK